MTSKQDEKVAELFASLEKGVQEVYTSDKYRKYLDTMVKFHDYSARNCLLILMQRPEASLVAGFNTWRNEFNRHVKRGEKGLFGGFCGRDSGIGPAQRAKTTIWN